MIRSPFRLALAVCTVLMVFIAPVAQAQGWRESSLAVSGVDRWYRVYVPNALPGNAPMVLLLHGGTESMRTIFDEKHGATREWLSVAEREKFLLVVPNGTNGRTGDTRGDRQNWNDLRSNPSESQSQADDVGFVSALLNRIEAEYGIDPKRIYVSGASNGGMMTYRLLIELPERFAAGAAFIAHLPRETDRLRPPARAVPLMIWSGTLDPLMKFHGGELIGGRGRVRSAQETVAWWQQANRADAQKAQARTLPDVDPGDGCRVEQTVYPALTGGAPVVFYRADGGGHSLPTRQSIPSGGRIRQRLIGPTCRDVEGAQLAWEFLRKFGLPR